MKKKKAPEIGSKESITKAGNIIERLKGRSPSLSDLDEYEDTEPPFPTYGGVALEEQLKQLKKKGKPSPYLPS